MPKFQPIRRSMTVKQQENYWVDGVSIHNSRRDECCPDFSCCDPKLRAPIEVRRKFRDANEDERQKMLVGFLGALLKSEGCKIVT